MIVGSVRPFSWPISAFERFAPSLVLALVVGLGAAISSAADLIEEEVYMDIPPGFRSKSEDNGVCKLKKSLYGLKQSPRAWFDRFTRVIKGEGYQQGHSDHTMFFRQAKDGKKTILIVYVDDIILTGDDSMEIERLKSTLTMEFETRDLGQMKYFLGMEVARSKKGISVSQRKYVTDLLKETGMLGCKPSDTPIESGKKTSNVGEPVDRERYQRLVGKLIYLSHTRPDIAFKELRFFGVDLMPSCFTELFHNFAHN